MKKALSYMLILVILIGLWSPLVSVRAQTPIDPVGTCTNYVMGSKDYEHHGKKSETGNPLGTPCPATATWVQDAVQPEGTPTLAPGTKIIGCSNSQTGAPVIGVTTKDKCSAPNVWTEATGNVATTVAGTPNPSANPLYDNLESCAQILAGSLYAVYGCIELFVYFLFVTIPSFLLSIVAVFFNLMVATSLNSGMYKMGFINTLWEIVRDFSNIFFILMLLYAAIEIILGLGHGNGKKIIGSVILIALIVNFSMFFTKIVIDAGNVLGLIFYNKIKTEHVSYEPISNANQTGIPENDIAGSLVSSFNVNKFFSADMLSRLDRDSRWFGLSSAISPAILIGMMVLYGMVIYSLTYAFFIAGISFLGRMLMLITLIIVSPFAFVSYAVPSFKKINTVGFDSWLHKLIETSFVAAVFMFIIYMVSEILKADIFNSKQDLSGAGIIKTLLLLFLPAILIVILVTKGAKYAQKASGEATEKLVSMGKAAAGIVGGVAIGAATGGAGLLATGTIGSLSSKVLSSQKLQDQAKQEGFGGAMARLKLRTAEYGTKTTFDVRKAPGIGSLIKATGADMGVAGAVSKGIGLREGGYEKIREEKVKRRQERAKQLNVREDEQLQQDLNMLQKDEQELLGAYAHTIEMLDGRIKSARENANDLNSKAKAINTDDPAKVALRKAELARVAALADTDPTKSTALAAANAMDVDDPAKVALKKAADDAAKEANDRLEELKAHKKAIKNGDTSFTRTRLTDSSLTGNQTSTVDFVDSRGIQNNIINGRSLNDLGDVAIPHAHDAIEKENRSRQWKYAERLEKKWTWSKTNREAAHKIRMKAKIEKGHDDHGGGHGGGGGHAPAAPAAHAPAPAAHAPAPAAHAPAAHDDHGGGGGDGHADGGHGHA